VFSLIKKINKYENVYIKIGYIMKKINEWKYIGDCCIECSGGIMRSMPEEVLKDGSVEHSRKCDKCGRKEEFKSEPWRSRRYTDITRCDKCGYEYFYETIFDPVSNKSLGQLFVKPEYFSLCPSCGVEGFQKDFIEFGPLKHEHGNYGRHPVTRKHRIK
jgi:hypothetical protein